jgi:HEAT repeat protein
MVETNFQGKSVSYWLGMLGDQDEKYRREAVVALRCIGLPAVPGLIRLFKDGHSHQRYWAVRALGQVGPKAKAALPVIRIALKDPSEEVRRAAATSLEQIAPDEAKRAFGFWSRVRQAFRWMPFTRAKARE